MVAYFQSMNYLDIVYYEPANGIIVNIFFAFLFNVLIAAFKEGKKSLISLVEVMNGDPENLLNEKLENQESFEKAIELIFGAKTNEAQKLLKKIYNPKIPDPVVKMHLDKIAIS